MAGKWIQALFVMDIRILRETDLITQLVMCKFYAIVSKYRTKNSETGEIVEVEHLNKIRHDAKNLNPGEKY